jgi:colanic acid biosynthesis glycosyl transferase WcaI
MRAAYLGINYSPDETGIAPFATGRCEYVATHGHQVVACTGVPYYPQWQSPPVSQANILP